MSRLTGNDAKGLIEAYAAVYAPLEEEREVEELGFQIIENAAYVLFSQGYDVDDLVDYFAEATTEVIIEDFVSFAEGQTYLSESFIVSDEYIAEQFELLNEKGAALGWLASQAGRAVNAVKGAVTGIQKSAKTYERAKNIQNIRNAKNTVPPGSAKVTTSGTTSGPRLPGTGPKITTSGGKPATPGMLQKAGDWAKTQLGKLPGAPAAQRFAKSGAGRFLGKMGSRVLPGLGVATYGMDAADRFKKGDWGGGLLSTAGAVTSAIPGGGLVAGLAPAAIQAATDAAGLTGDKSKKGPSAKTPPAGAPKPPKGAGTVNVPGKGQRYFASSDKKYYRNYNDALAARRSRRGEGVPAPAKPTPAAAAPEVKATNTIAAKPTQPPVAPTSTPNKKPATGKLGNTSFERRTPTSAEFKGAQEYRQQNPGAKPEDTLKAAQEAGRREKEKAASEKLKNSPSPNLNLSHYEYDSFDLVLEYLLSEGHVDTLDEALYVMMEMDSETIQGIVE